MPHSKHMQLDTMPATRATSWYKRQCRPRVVSCRW